MAKRFQFTQFLGVRNETAEYVDPFMGTVKFTVKSANDPDYVDWLRKRSNPMEALARRAGLRAALAASSGEESPEVAALPYEQKLLHYVKDDVLSSELEEQVNLVERAEDAAHLVVNAEGLLGYDDEDEEPELEAVGYSHEAVVEVLAKSHGGRIPSGEYKGQYVNDVLVSGIKRTAAALARAQEEALEEAAKN